MEPPFASLDAATEPIRFGVFELDPSSGELRKRGFKVKLQQQPLRLLRVLLERPGEVVTREELTSRLWPAGVYVDFDRSLNIAIVKLREVLGDSAESPRFIETVPRLGYRFIASVATHAAPLPAEERSGVRIHDSDSTGSATVPQKRPGLQRAAALGVVTLVVFLFVLSGSFLMTPPPPRVLSATQISNSLESKIPRLVSDGARLYFSQTVGGLVTPVQLSVEGGDVLPRATPLKNEIIFDVSPRSSELLVGTLGTQYESESPLWIEPLLGVVPHRVGSITAHGAAWSPDGQAIVYASGNELYVASRNGSRQRKLVSAPEGLYWPGWSPDGKTLRYSMRGADSSLWEVAANGGQPRRLLADWTDRPQECCGSWTPDGRYYLFQSTQNGRTDIWATRVGGVLEQKWGKPVRLTNGPLDMMAPLPSRDGKRIYVVGEQRLGELVRYDSHSKQFEPYLGGISAEGVARSRNGEWVAYVSYPEGILWRSKADGSQKLQLSQPPLVAAVPQWSPDGRQIAFVGTGGSVGRWKIFLVSANGGEPQQLVPGKENEFSPWWSADSRFVIYGGFPSNSAKGLRIVDVVTHQVSSVPGSVGFCCPTWSRDQRHIFALGIKPGRIVVFDSATQKWSELWKGTFNYYDLSTDEKYLYFDTKLESDPAVFRLRLADGKLEEVVSLQGFRRTHGFLGDWFDLAADDSPLLLRNLSSQQIYALAWQAP